MKDTDKSFSKDPLDEDIFDDISDIDGIDEEYYAEFGDEEFDDDYDERLEKVLDELAELKTNMAGGAPAARQSAAYTPASNGQNEAALYNEISRLRDELNKTQNTQAIQSELNKLREEFNRNGRGDADLRDEVIRLKAQLRAMKNGGGADDTDDLDSSYNGASGSDIRKLYSELTASLADTEQRIIDSVDAISKRLDGEIKFAENEDVADVFQALKDLRSDISKVSRSADETGAGVINASSPDEVNLFLSEIVSLRDELQEYKDNVSVLIDKISGRIGHTAAKEDDESISGSGDNVTIMLDELTSIRTEISNYSDGLDALRSGMADIKNIVRAGVISSGDGSSSLETAVILSEIGELKAKLSQGGVSGEVAALREELKVLSGGAKNEEIELLRGEIRQLNEQLGRKPAHAAIVSVQESELPSDVKEMLSVIFDEIRAIRQEPDYSVMNEILALREEFQSLKEQVSGSSALRAQPAVTSAFDHEGAYKQTVEEIRSLRDQLFAISMAKVANGKKESEYENYNNILLDEIASLREDLERYNKPIGDQLTVIAAAQKEDKKDGKGIEKLSEELAKLEDTVAKLSQKLEDTGNDDKLLGELKQLKESITSIADAVDEAGKKETVINVPVAEIEGIDEIKDSLSSQKDVNKTMLGMLSDIMRAVESLRAEAPEKPKTDSYDAVMDELAKLRDMVKTLEKTEPAPTVVEVVNDNKNIEEAITKLRDELAAISGLGEAKAAKDETAATKDRKPSAKKTAEKKKTAEEKPVIKKAEEKKPAAKAAPKAAAVPKKAPAKKPAAKAVPKKEESKAEAPPKKEEPKAEEAPKIADKQALDEYVATLDKGESDDISKMLRDILSYEDSGDDI